MATVYSLSFIGKKINKLTILSIAKSVKIGYCRVNAICECGVTKDYALSSIINETSRSCGCYKKEKATKHGLKKHPLYDIYMGIKHRCNNPNDIGYKTYGGNGVILCEEWGNDFLSFYNWAISNGWKRGLQIDKDILSGGNGKIYSPEKCSIVTPKINNRHKDANVLIEYKGETKCIAEWAEIINIHYHRLWQRISRGWGISRAFNTPINKYTVR